MLMNLFQLPSQWKPLHHIQALAVFFRNLYNIKYTESSREMNLDSDVT